ncbi:MAG: hypothetical protein H6565_05035 [Lewinellaceae bacterium]|nr:hypothetical protein [Lewinellaceae bacterium]
MVFQDTWPQPKQNSSRTIVFSFSVRDAFASRIRESVTDQANFYLYNWGRRGRFVTLGFSYGFGKGEAMEYSGQRRHF